MPAAPQGATLGPLDGIPYTAKDSYLVRGLTAAAGSPAFADLVAQRDAFTIERLRAAGAICLGLTNMPPMANGGMQRGLYGRAESPYNADYLTAPFASGSSNGSGTATAASFAAFGLGEETWSSGRGPASNNALCAYTPSRGVISVRGNWPLVPTMDVVVPHTRTMADLLEVLDVVVADDPRRAATSGARSRGSAPRRVDACARRRTPPSPRRARTTPRGALAGRRIGVPRMYINADTEAGTAAVPGIGGPTGTRIETRAVGDRPVGGRAPRPRGGGRRPSSRSTSPWCRTTRATGRARRRSRRAGSCSPEYLRARDRRSLGVGVGGLPRARTATPRCSTLAEVDGAPDLPAPGGPLPDRYTGFDDDIAEYPDWVREHPRRDAGRTSPSSSRGLRGLEETRRIDLEEWMDGLGLDAVVFPAVADVGPADMDVNPASADLGWRNGVWVANGNLAIRHLGIPTVTVPMGLMADIGMPVGLTFAGRAYDDVGAAATRPPRSRRSGPRRVAPPRTPPLPLTR